MVSARVIRRLLAVAAAIMLVSFQTAVLARACVVFDDAAGGQAPASQVLDLGIGADAPSGHELCPAQNPLGSAVQPALSQFLAFNAGAVPVAIPGTYPPFVSTLAAATAKAWTASTEPPPLTVVHCCYRN